ncbi:uncharacterized protein LOC131551415 isoform X2 [Onychostoma macrolepis]|uniref:uncharacterized protein LOC131551415 isoform X2 n=1 Tax=Onychostoma macrolepis TaxID=369639 RepID=UPI00272CC862|nr:uncharacterized protein LOC131551415 isoform X2 [Onychostoma macrolepis]
MNAINAVQLFFLLWTFTAVCQADDDFFSVTCQNVTGSVGKQATFTCKIHRSAKCCIVMYKFQYPESYKDSTIRKEEFTVNSCEERNSFTCRFTPTTAKTEQFRFFVQTKCGVKRTEFTVDITGYYITETIKPEILAEVVTPGKTEPAWDVSETSEQNKAEGRGFKIAVIAAVISCLIIIIMPIIYRMTQKHPKQKRTFLVFRHDEDNSNHPENVI